MASNSGQMAHSSTGESPRQLAAVKKVQTAVKQMQLIESSVSQSAEVVARLAEPIPEIRSNAGYHQRHRRTDESAMALNAATGAARAGEQGAAAVEADEGGASWRSRARRSASNALRS